MSTMLKTRDTDEILSEIERIIRLSQISEYEVRFDFIVHGEGQCKLYQEPFMIVLFVAHDDWWVRTFQASERAFRSADLQRRFLLFSQEVTGLQRSIERQFNQPTGSMWRV